MLAVTPRATEILDRAEHYIRSVGYSGFSFRDIAEDTGIKSASVHYHFPTKEQLALAVARRYSERFFAALGRPGDLTASPKVQIDVFVEVFRGALKNDGRMCLFCVLGAEFMTLPPEVQDVVRNFFVRAADRLAALLLRFDPASKSKRHEALAAARTVLASLQGAMILSRANNDLALFDSIVDQLKTVGLIPANPTRP